MEYVLIACRTVVALVFVMSAAGKLRGAQAYAEFVASTRRLAPRRARPRQTAAAVVAAEVAVPLLLAVPMTVPAGFGLAGVLLAGFAVAIVAAVRRGERTPCRCFGASAQPLGLVQVVRNLLLIAIAALGTLATQAPAAPGLAGAAAAVITGGVVAAVAIAADDIAALFRPAGRSIVRIPNRVKMPPQQH